MTKSKGSARSLLRSLAFPLLFCCLGIGSVLLFERMNRDDVNWFGQPMSNFRDVPPEWITYQQASVCPCSVAGQATCFALLNDSTFIIGSVNPPSLSLFDDKGTLLQKLDLPEEPQAVACGTPATQFTDKIVVAHSKHIAVYTTGGAIVPLCELPDEKSDVRSLIFTPQYLFAADTGKRCIYRLAVDNNNASGTAKGNIDLTFGADFVVYASPITMTFSPTTDLLYITNPGKHRVEVFTQDGEYKPELGWGEPSGNMSGFVGCCNPIALATLEDGRILTVEKSVSRIKIFTDGKLDCVVAGPNTLELSANRPAVPGGHTFSAVPLFGGRIAVFDFEGQMLRIFTPL